MLIVIDNFEQVIDAAPDIATLMAQCPLVKFLATSCEPLRIAGERLYPVAPLELPATAQGEGVTDLAQCPSVQLFVERARAVQPSFTLTDENAAAVSDICRHLLRCPNDQATHLWRRQPRGTAHGNRPRLASDEVPWAG